MFILSLRRPVTLLARTATRRPPTTSQYPPNAFLWIARGLSWTAFLSARAPTKPPGRCAQTSTATTRAPKYNIILYCATPPPLPRPPPSHTLRGNAENSSGGDIYRHCRCSRSLCSSLPHSQPRAPARPFHRRGPPAATRTQWYISVYAAAVVVSVCPDVTTADCIRCAGRSVYI